MYHRASFAKCTVNMSVFITEQQRWKQQISSQAERVLWFWVVYLVGAYWGAAVLRLQAVGAGSALQAQRPGWDSRRSGPPWAVADLSLTAASVLAGGSVEAPREAGNGLQLAAGRRQTHVYHCCHWRGCWWKYWYWCRQVGAGLNRSW